MLLVDRSASMMLKTSRPKPPAPTMKSGAITGTQCSLRAEESPVQRVTAGHVDQSSRWKTATECGHSGGVVERSLGSVVGQGHRRESREALSQFCSDLT